LSNSKTKYLECFCFLYYSPVKLDSPHMKDKQVPYLDRLMSCLSIFRRVFSHKSTKTVKLLTSTGQWIDRIIFLLRLMKCLSCIRQNHRFQYTLSSHSQVPLLNLILLDCFHQKAILELCRCSVFIDRLLLELFAGLY
jgi:hypothetical protein